ncbi:histidine kinase [Pedobacter terrae]|nr:histidine kinase [Pedobacter terrae]
MKLSNGWLRELQIFGNSFYYDTALLYLFAFGFFHSKDYFEQFEVLRIKERDLLLLHHESEKNVLSAQMHPHFLFNILNSINASIPAKLEDTRESIAKLAQTYRYILNASKVEETLLSSELEFFINYINLQNDPKKNIINFDVATQHIILNKRKCPPMFLNSVFMNLIGVLQEYGNRKINIILEISRVSEVLRFETNITLSEPLSRKSFIELAKLNTLSMHKDFVRDFNIFQSSTSRILLIFFTPNYNVV